MNPTPPVTPTLHKFVPTLSAAATPVVNLGNPQYGDSYIKGGGIYSGFHRGPTTKGYASYVGTPVSAGKVSRKMSGR